MEYAEGFPVEIMRETESGRLVIQASNEASTTLRKLICWTFWHGF